VRCVADRIGRDGCHAVRRLAGTLALQIVIAVTIVILIHTGRKMRGKIKIKSKITIRIFEPNISPAALSR
jgi:hypothetical protein